MRLTIAHCRKKRNRSRGVATIWLVLLFPAILILLCLVIEAGNLWLARSELEDALDSAALAAVEEWASGSSTFVSRRVGLDFASSNSVRNNAVLLSPNYNAANLPNENASCNGDLVFGAITSTAPNVVFNAGVAPSCVQNAQTATVLLDVTHQGDMIADVKQNAWGIAFRRTATTPSNLLITRVEIDLRAGGGNGRFRLQGAADPSLSTNLPLQKVRDLSGNSQLDIVGFPNPSSQISFNPSNGNPPRLRIDFSPNDAGTDQGFEPGDRFRFRARVENVGNSAATTNDGDGIGNDRVEITVHFSIGGVAQPLVVTSFVDTTELMNACFNPALADPNPLSNSIIVHPARIPDLPCPESNTPGNNGQSYVELRHLFAGGSGVSHYAVRAQATVNINSIHSSLFEFLRGPATMSAQSTAMYDCNTNEARLIRVDQIICP